MVDTRTFYGMLIILIALAMGSMPAGAAVWNVAPSGGDFTSIQDAVNMSAPSGDTILVAYADYDESVIISGLDITIRGIPDGATGAYPSFSNTSGTATAVFTYIDADVDLSGLVISDASSDDFGVNISGFVDINLDNITVSGFSGAGIYVRDAVNTVAITEVDASNNTGYGIFFDYTGPFTGNVYGTMTMEHVTADNNDAGNIVLHHLDYDETGDMATFRDIHASGSANGRGLATGIVYGPSLFEDITADTNYRSNIDIDYLAETGGYSSTLRDIHASGSIDYIGIDIGSIYGPLTMVNITAENNDDDNIELGTLHGSLTNLTTIRASSAGCYGLEIGDVYGQFIFDDVIADDSVMDNIYIYSLDEDDNGDSSTLSNIHASGSREGNGIEIDDEINGPLTLRNVTASGNYDLNIEIDYGDYNSRGYFTTLDTVTANDCTRDYGILVRSEGPVRFYNITANGNYYSGVYVDHYIGGCTVDNLTANGNGFGRADLMSTYQISGLCLENPGYSTGPVTITDVTADNNMGPGVYLRRIVGGEMSDISATNNSVGLLATSANDAVYEGIEANNNDFAGILFARENRGLTEFLSDNLTLTDCTATGNPYGFMMGGTTLYGAYQLVVPGTGTFANGVNYRETIDDATGITNLTLNGCTVRGSTHADVWAAPASSTGVIIDLLNSDAPSVVSFDFDGGIMFTGATAGDLGTTLPALPAGVTTLSQYGIVRPVSDGYATNVTFNFSYAGMQDPASLTGYLPWSTDLSVETPAWSLFSGTGGNNADTDTVWYQDLALSAEEGMGLMPAVAGTPPEEPEEPATPVSSSDDGDSPDLTPSPTATPSPEATVNATATPEPTAEPTQDIAGDTSTPAGENDGAGEPTPTSVVPVPSAMGGTPTKTPFALAGIPASLAAAVLLLRRP